ncbi:hypothetical protein FNV43_RR24014 [Rhamnella rubrinervis]|uniref:Membrane-associated kinase regulator 5 n=1 Tax=Rhamnella rubrinervis TaxID=2594499 RepID=A0A8K0GKT3_9ROSA|nr:hypothetical protein FNV43_RR24014 [Rhamnella rubrinervis]
METLNFLKFWKPNTSIPSPVAEADCEVDDEEDSFFDLELTAPDYDSTGNNNTSKNNDYPDEKTTENAKGIGFKEERAKCSDKTAGDGELFCPKPELLLSPADPISKRKILPVEPISKPQSPIALLKSAPRFRVSMFKKPKSTVTQKTEKTGEAEPYNIFMGTQKQQRQQGKLFAVKFNVEEAHNLSTLNRESSMRYNGSKPQNQSSHDSKAERKDVLQKYLKLIKPLYVKASKRYSDKMKFPSDLSVASPASSPVPAAPICSPKEKQANIPAGIRNVCKHLGKSKSASASAVSATVPQTNRRDDSLLQQHDGIQSAILHCKRSFNSSRDSSSLSRSTSDSSSMKSCLSDSSLLSHFISESTQDKSARSSIEDICGVGI